MSLRGIGPLPLHQSLNLFLRCHRPGTFNDARGFSLPKLFATDLSGRLFLASLPRHSLHPDSCYKLLIHNLKHTKRRLSVVRPRQVRIPPSPPVFPYQELLGVGLIFCRPLVTREKQKRRFNAPEISSRFEGPAKRQNTPEKRSVKSAVKFLSVNFLLNLR